MATVTERRNTQSSSPDTHDSAERSDGLQIASVFCPEEGRPKKTVRLKPGTSKVAAKVSDPSVIPFSGIWELKGDTGYFNCFFIVTKIG